ncbi:hypothetical protein E2C01_044663 [Portunus trituberculatus]|uniref:Uncharacterized protein n=1 Tax=Portunus trituberculatus TaxID=210409 RepID=A0A5B7FSQ4_PORTR|nr:hypothetical protein [Portunus trituberculatus]
MRLYSYSHARFSQLRDHVCVCWPLQACCGAAHRPTTRLDRHLHLSPTGTGRAFPQFQGCKAAPPYHPTTAWTATHIVTPSTTLRLHAISLSPSLPLSRCRSPTLNNLPPAIPPPYHPSTPSPVTPTPASTPPEMSPSRARVFVGNQNRARSPLPYPPGDVSPRREWGKEDGRGAEGEEKGLWV